jgi:uncharacterized protein
MKYLVLIVIVFAVIWFIRANRRADAPKGEAPPPQPGPGVPQDMVRCAVCALHLPRADALPGPGGRLYCCAEHRAKD